MTAGATYFLSNDCFVCRAQDYWIVLDTRRDRYSCVTHADLSSIGHRLFGWRSQSGVEEHIPPFAATEDALISSMKSTGIITSDSSKGKSFAESDCAPRDRALNILSSSAPVERPPLCVLRFFLACLGVGWRLRTKQFSHTLARIEQRRLHVPPTAAVHDVAYISRLIAAFRDLRPLYPRSTLCLFDSLALLEFLAKYGAVPQIIFGVIADPFQAHCWLQHGSVVINDDLERVGKYKPILSL